MKPVFPVSENMFFPRTGFFREQSFSENVFFPRTDFQALLGDVLPSKMWNMSAPAPCKGPAKDASCPNGSHASETLSFVLLFFHPMFFCVLCWLGDVGSG